MSGHIRTFFGRLRIFKSLRAIFFIIIFLVGVVPCVLLQNGLLRDYEQRAVEVRVEQVKGQLRSLANHLISSNYLINQESGQVDAELAEFSILYDGRLLIIDPSLTVVKDTYGLSDNKTIVSQEVISCLQTGDRAGSENYDRQYGYIEVVIPIIETRSMEGLDYFVRENAPSYGEVLPDSSPQSDRSSRGMTAFSGTKQRSAGQSGADNSSAVRPGESAGVTDRAANSAASGVVNSAASGLSSNAVRGVLLASTSTEYIQKTKDILRRKALLLQALMLVVVFIASMLLSGFLVRPFEKLSRDILEVKEGYSSEPITAPQYAETMHIADSFNTVLGRMNALDESRREFVANVSHELKTPMTSMKVLAASLLSEEEVDPVVYREFLEDIDSEIDRENKIITDLLALVREDRTNTELEVIETNINLLAEAVLKRIRPIAQQRDIALTLVSRQEVKAEVDATRMNLVLTNLVENAVKYNREHGEVTVTIDADDQYFQVMVRDNGIGIPEDARSRIYERFYRVDKSRSREIGGTGLGLSIAKSAVLRHHGTISLESREGEGTTFTVRIPLRYSSAPMELRVGRQRRQITGFLRGRKNQTARQEYLEKTIHVSRRKGKTSAGENDRKGDEA